MWKVVLFDELDSTNAYAKKQCSLLADKTVIVARRQSAGRGRLNRSWCSEPGGLYFSVVLKPQKTDFLPNLTQAMALSVCQSVRALGANAWLKWPNDVLADGKKLCGILSEAVTSRQGVEALVLGVGLNVCQRDLSAAGQPAVSLKNLGIHTDTHHVLNTVLDHFFTQYEKVLQNGFESIRTAYLEYFPYVGKEVAVRYGAHDVCGQVKTISPDGRLLLSTPEGTMEISIGDMMV